MTPVPELPMLSRLALLALSLAGCLDPEADRDDFGDDTDPFGWGGQEGSPDGSSGDDEPEGEDGEFGVAVYWTEESVELVIAGGEGEYSFGMAETGASSPVDAWYGEDCIYGDPWQDYFLCHTDVYNGISLAYGGDPDTLEEGAETAFGSPGFEPNVTYFLESADTGACWTWGHDPTYYGDPSLGCTVL